MFNYCQHCATRLWSDYAKTLRVCPECEEPDKPLQDLEEVLEDSGFPLENNSLQSIDKPTE